MRIYILSEMSMPTIIEAVGLKRCQFIFYGFGGHFLHNSRMELILYYISVLINDILLSAEPLKLHCSVFVVR